MIKTVNLNGSEISVTDLGGFNTVVHNLGDDVIYASKYPNISADGDNVAEIPAGAAKLISTTNGTVYLLGTGKAELTGQDHDGVNYFAGGGSGVSKSYVDSGDENTLYSANAYTDNTVGDLENKVGDLLNSKADKSEIPTTLPANGGNADTAERTVWENHVKDNTDILELADNAPELQRSFVRVNSSKNCPTDYGYSETNNDFWYVIDKLDALYATIIAVDVKSSAIFINTKSGGSWMGWKKIITDE